MVREPCYHVGIDPAKDGLALATVSGERVIGCQWFPSGEIQTAALQVAVLAVLGTVFVRIERPQIYLQSRWKGDPNDLIDVAFTVGAFRHALDVELNKTSTPCMCLRLLRPHEWKGTTPKKISHERICSRLSEGEIFLLDAVPRARLGDALDAVGIALFSASSTLKK